MKIETTEDLAEEIADWLELYGGCITENCTKDETKPYFCCRNIFVTNLIDRITNAVNNTKKLEQINLQ